ncbi:MAG: carbohydrate ABC transporter permease [Candidatus Omnitrophica bacterium]|nr:carbohydrate ABC transporter permease [Candidatus Omnitrophota bacterium]
MRETTLADIKRRRQVLDTVSFFLSYAFLILGAMAMIAPFLWMLTTSLSEARDVWRTKEFWWQGWVPTKFIYQNYIEAFQVVPFAKFYLNSIFVTLCITAGTVFTSSLAGYAFARLSFPGRDKIFMLYLATLMLPGVITMIPVFILLSKLGWIDTYWAIILPGIFTAYGTFLLRQFFMSLPRALEDAAKIDGCSLFGIYFRIILPLSKPALATLTTFTFMGSWMSFMWPLIVLSSEEKYTLPIGIQYFKSLHSTDWTLLMAGSVMALFPILVVFIFTQRYFVEGIKLSGIKG